jgi:hypothetical protein
VRKRESEREKRGGGECMRACVHVTHENFNKTYQNCVFLPIIISLGNAPLKSMLQLKC